MDLNLFDNKRNESSFISKFIEELKSALNNMMNEKRGKSESGNELEQYNLYEKKKVFLDNKTRGSNDLAWIMDNNSVCISEDGDGGPISIGQIDLPEGAKVGEVYEKIDGKYIYNPDITMELSEII